MYRTWLVFWLMPATTLTADLATCNRKWVKMNDRNYNRAIRHYSDCVLLGQALDPPARQNYQANIIMNMKRTCNYFFDRSALPTSNLIGVVREVARILEDFDEETISQPKRLSGTNVLKQQCTTRVHSRDGLRLENTTVHSTCGPTESVTTKKPDCNRTQYSDSQGYLLLTLFFFLVLLILQFNFLIWFCCCNNCMCLELCKSEKRGMRSNESNKEDLQDTDTYYMQEMQHDLASLSSENVGSDSEFEALLKMNKVPKAKKPFHSKEAD